MTAHITANSHLTGDIEVKVKFHPDGIASEGQPYGSVDIDGITLFVNTPGQAEALADAFGGLAEQFTPNSTRTFVLNQARYLLAEYHQWQDGPIGATVDGNERHYRYAEFCGRFATLLAELTPDAPEDGTS